MEETSRLPPEPEGLGKSKHKETYADVRQQPEAGKERKMLAQSIKVKLKAQQARG